MPTDYPWTHDWSEYLPEKFQQLLDKQIGVKSREKISLYPDNAKEPTLDISYADNDKEPTLDKSYVS